MGKLNKNSKLYIIEIVIFALGLIATMIFIFSNSLRGSVASENQSSSALDAVKPAVDIIFYPIVGSEGVSHSFFRKIAHWSEFCLLSFFATILGFITNRSRYRWITNSMFFGLVVAVIDESLQIISGRGSAVKDVLIDYWGFSTFVICFVILILIINIIKTVKLKKQMKGGENEN